MAATVRPRRSALYMPGSNARALEKGRSLPADVLILDLEDAVTPDSKQLARDQIVAAARAGGYGGREIAVRVNGLYTPWGEADIAAIASSGVDAILLPKVEDGATVHAAKAIMAGRGAPDSMAIWCMMETPLGMLYAEEIAGASRRVACLVMGTADLAKDLHAHYTPLRLPMLTSLGLCLLATRAYGLAVLDGVHLDLADDEGFAESCQQGLELGFGGKTLIHPKTIAKANEVFAPSADEIGHAHKIIAAHGAAAAEGKGVVLVDGRLVENLHVESARRLVAMADAIAALEAAAA